MSADGQRAQRVVLVASASAAVAGGPAAPIAIQPAGTPASGAPVIRVAIVVGRAVQGGPAMPVVVVTGPSEGGPALPVTIV